MALTFVNLPAEVLLELVGYLGIKDFYGLKATQKDLFLMLQNDIFAQAVFNVSVLLTEDTDGILMTIPKHNTNHAETVKDLTTGDVVYSRSLSRVHYRQEAFAQAKPLSILTLGYSRDFFYRQGVLCYVCHDTIRILHAHQASQNEKVIHPNALRRAPFDMLLLHIVHYQDGILTFRIANGYAPLMLCVDISGINHTAEEKRIGFSHRLVLTLSEVRYFVRNNSEYLVRGEYIWKPARGRSEWVLVSFDLVSGRRSDEQQLHEFFGNDIGQTICFELFHGYLYAVSSQSTREVEEIDWSSSYVCYRIPVGHSREEKVQRRRIWRRQHREGPINDAYLNISLQEDQQTGAITIVEARQEFLNGGSEQTRSFYFSRLDFTEEQSTNETSLPTDDILVSTLDKTNRPQYEPAKPRTAYNVHTDSKVDESGHLRKECPPSKNKYRTYLLNVSASLDLIHDDRVLHNHKPQLRLRIGSRTPASPIDPSTGRLYAPSLDANGNPIPNTIDRYKSNPTKLWPPANAPPQLLTFLNHPDIANVTSKAKLTAMSDGGTLIIAAGPQDRMHGQRLLLINFDPAIRFRGLPKLDMREVSGEEQAEREREQKEAVKDGRRKCSEAQEMGEPRMPRGEREDREGLGGELGREEKAWWVEMMNGFEFVYA